MRAGPPVMGTGDGEQSGRRPTGVNSFGRSFEIFPTGRLPPGEHFPCSESSYRALPDTIFQLRRPTAHLTHQQVAMRSKVSSETSALTAVKTCRVPGSGAVAVASRAPDGTVPGEPGGRSGEWRGPGEAPQAVAAPAPHPEGRRYGGRWSSRLACRARTGRVCSHPSAAREASLVASLSRFRRGAGRNSTARKAAAAPMTESQGSALAVPAACAWRIPSWMWPVTASA